MILAFFACQYQLFSSVKRCYVSILEAIDPRLWAQLLFDPGLEHCHEQGKGQRPVDKEIAVSLDLAAVLRIQMNGMSVEGQGRVAEEKRSRWY
jgi:hypothetical protein